MLTVIGEAPHSSCRSSTSWLSSRPTGMFSSRDGAEFAAQVADLWTNRHKVGSASYV